MNKCICSLMLVALLSGYQAMSAATPKEERIKVLFDLTTNRKNITPLFAPLLAQTQWKDEQTKNATLDKIVDLFCNELEQKFTVMYDRLFEMSEIDELIAFQTSAVGKKLAASTASMASEMSQVGMNFVTKAQKIIAEESKTTSQPTA